MQTVSKRDSWHEISDPIFFEQILTIVAPIFEVMLKRNFKIFLECT